MRAGTHFPPCATVAELNDETCARWAEMPVHWSLVADEARFHAFLVLEAGAPLRRTLRIDWHATSVLECRPYEPTHGDEHIAVGETRGFCLACVAKTLAPYDRDYHLFAYNCRTVAYLILTKYAGFDETAVLQLYEQHEMLCGVGGLEQCISPEEFMHYVRHRELEQRQGHDVDKELAEAGRYFNVQ